VVSARAAGGQYTADPARRRPARPGARASGPAWPPPGRLL